MQIDGRPGGLAQPAILQFCNLQFRALEYSMPLFEYECRGCGHHFEHLTREDRPPVCPACAGENLQKMFSVFAAQSSTPAKSFAHPSAKGPIGPQNACGHCGDPRGPGACSMN